MMANTTIQVGRRIAAGLRSDRGQLWLRLAGYGAGGFLLAAAALMEQFQPLALGLVCVLPGGWPAVCTALGGAAGYWFFWNSAQGAVWMALGLGAAMVPRRRGRWLAPALAASAVALSGMAFLLQLGEDPGFGVYLLRVGVAFGATAVFGFCREHPGTGLDWVAQALWVLALAQVAPVGYVNLGCVAAGFLGAAGAFPGAALAGLALDLARVTRVPMTGVLCLGACLRMLPWREERAALLCPALAFLPVAVLCGAWDGTPLPGLLLGGILAGVLPGLSAAPRAVHRRGETAVAQVRLEQMALVLGQMEQALRTTSPPEPDREALLLRAVDSACDTCPERRNCRARPAARELSPVILEQPGLGSDDLPPGCRKPARLVGELRRGQEQLRRIKGDRSRREDCRAALGQQYGFLSELLKNLSDDLQQRRRYRHPRFQVEVGVCTRSLQSDNGDRCVWFPGTRNRYYVALCDGMGTGTAAMVESRAAAELLRQMLGAGLPAADALRSLNSMAVLRDMGGCVTVDLAEIHLDTGRCELYKWGAASSYLCTAGQLRKIGTAGPPPGLSQQARESVDRLSLGGGEVLILLSDGAGEEGLLQSQWTAPELSPGEMAAAILEHSADGGDDATAAVIRLGHYRVTTQ